MTPQLPREALLAFADECEQAAKDLRNDRVYGCCAGTYEHCAAHIRAALETPPPQPRDSALVAETPAWTDEDMRKPWGAEIASLLHLADDPALNIEQTAMLRHCAKRIEATADNAYGWRPIATAPKDRKPIALANAEHGVVANGHWENWPIGGKCGVWCSWPYIHGEPTHWSPLPPNQTVLAAQPSAGGDGAVAWRYYITDDAMLNPFWTGWSTEESYRTLMESVGYAAVQYAYPPAAREDKRWICTKVTEDDGGLFTDRRYAYNRAQMIELRDRGYSCVEENNHD